MKTTGNKIIAEFTADLKSTFLPSGKTVMETTTLEDEALYLTMKVVAVGNVVKAEGIDVGDLVYLPATKQSPYLLSTVTLEGRTIETYIFDIYSILGFDKVEKDVEPSQA